MKIKLIQSISLVFITLLLSSCNNDPLRLQPKDTIGFNHNRPDWIENEEVYREEGLSFRESDSLANLNPPIASIYFDYDGSAISTPERTKIAEVAEYVKTHPEAQLLVVGHCDYFGTQEYNLSLGDKRSVSVKNFLSQVSGNKPNIRTLSRGSLDAKLHGSKEDCQPDRRADIIVLK